MSQYSRDLDPDFAPELQPRTVQVFFPDKVASEDMLELYFENTRRSGGRDIAEIHIDQSSKCAFVTFDDPDGKKWLHQMPEGFNC